MLDNGFAIGLLFDQVGGHLEGSGSGGWFLKRVGAGHDTGVESGGDIRRYRLSALIADQIIGYFGAGSGRDVDQVNGAEIFVGGPVIQVNKGGVIEEVGVVGEDGA